MCCLKEVCVSKFEIISLTISIIALIISTVSIVRARKTQSAFLELEKIHVELSKFMLCFYLLLSRPYINDDTLYSW
jgi:multisubunit Na+/H+ antiporter MnhF subunit